MNEENLLQISSLNILEQYQIIIEFYSENKLNNVEFDFPAEINKEYFLDINEEIDNNNIIIKYLSLSKIFLCFINIDFINEFNNNNNFAINNFILFEKNFENLFNIKNIQFSYENNLLSNLFSNLNFFYNFYINLTKDENNNNNNNNNIEFYLFLFFFKINIYLIFLIMFFHKKEQSMINYIKLNSNEIEEILLKIIKLSDTHKFLPCRNILILFYLYFNFLITNNNNNNNKNNNNDINNNTIRKITNKKIFLTKLNYNEFLYPNPPLIFINVNNTLNTTNLIERFYRKNTLKLDDVNKLEKTIIVQILRILLFTFDNKNNSNNNSIKDFFIDYYILFYYQKNNKLSENSFLLSSNDNNNTDINNNNNNLTDTNNLSKSNNNNNINYNNTTSNINNIKNNNNNNNNTSNLITENNQIELDFNNFIEMFSLNNNNNNNNNSNNNNNNNNNDNNNEIEKDNNIILIDILNRNSIIYVIISLYYKILKSFKKNNLIQYTNFIFRLKDSNGLLVFLRLMKQENKTIEENFLIELNNNNVNEFYSEFINKITYLNLKLVYKIIKNNDEYINKCIECKSSIMLKKLLNMFESNKKIKIIVLKLFKEQIKFFDKNWRNENVNIITEIYINLKVDNENNNLYLERKDKLGKENNSIYFKEEELIKLFEEFHEYNYFKYIKNHNEFDNYKLNQLESIYAKLLRKLTNKLN